MSTRLNIEVSDEFAELIGGIALRNNSTKADVVRKALAVLKVAERQRDKGRVHFGFTKDPDALDTEIVNLFD